MTKPENQIWAYLHNELPPEKKELFEQALENDPDLRVALEESRAMHKDLEYALPRFSTEEGTDDQLEEQLLAEWEAEHPEYAEVPALNPRRKILQFTLPLAAAAAAVILLSLSLQTGPVQWQRTAYGTPPQLRDQSNAQARYSRAQLKEIDQKFKQAVESASQHAEQWILQVSLQELTDGALAIEISGYPRHKPDSPKTWSEHYQSLEEFHDNIPVLAKQIAVGMAGYNEL
jgi:anti-sigma factor RsiW